MAIVRLIVCRSPAVIPIKPSFPWENESVISSVPEIDFATSTIYFAGTNAVVEILVDIGDQFNFATASRLPSVAASSMLSPSMMKFIPVRCCLKSSRAAATPICEISVVNSFEFTVPEGSGISSAGGYSAVGMVCKVNDDLPLVISTLVPVATKSIGAAGSARMMSDRSRPEISTSPGS